MYINSYVWKVLIDSNTLYQLGQQRRQHQIAATPYLSQILVHPFSYYFDHAIVHQNSWTITVLWLNDRFVTPAKWRPFTTRHEHRSTRLICSFFMEKSIVYFLTNWKITFFLSNTWCHGINAKQTTLCIATFSNLSHLDADMVLLMMFNPLCSLLTQCGELHNELSTNHAFHRHWPAGPKLCSK